MGHCCKQAVSGDVAFTPDCYSWCRIDVNASGDTDFLDALQSATDNFGYCLSHGENATSPIGMVCNQGTNLTQPQASATITSTSVRGMPSDMATSSIGTSATSGGDTTETTGNGAAAPTQTGSAKAAGFLGVLLAAGAIGGAL